MVLMANRYILPAAFAYQKDVGSSVAAVKAAGGKSVEGKKTLDTLTKLTDTFKQRTDRLAKALELGVNDYLVRPIDRDELVARALAAFLARPAVQAGLLVPGPDTP